MTFRQTASATLGAAITATAMSLSATPATATECIAPSAPGGGWDFTCRTIGRILSELDLVDGNVQVTNMPGGVGAVTFAMVATERPGDEDLIVATSTVGITQIAQGRYPAPLDAMRYLAMLGADVGVIAVDDDSPDPDAGRAQRTDGERSGVGGDRGLLRRGRLGPHPPSDGGRRSRARGPERAPLGAVRWRHRRGDADDGRPDRRGLDRPGRDRGLCRIRRHPHSRGAVGRADPGLPRHSHRHLAGRRRHRLQLARSLYRRRRLGRGLRQVGVGPGNALQLRGMADAAVESGLVPIWRGGAEFEEFVREQAAVMEEISRDIGIIE
jgi:putative tricarboxylic transport membrane protein